jgi:hypothetical protein
MDEALAKALQRQVIRREITWAQYEGACETIRVQQCKQDASTVSALCWGVGLAAVWWLWRNR